MRKNRAPHEPHLTNFQITALIVTAVIAFAVLVTLILLGQDIKAAVAAIVVILLAAGYFITRRGPSGTDGGA